MLFRSIHQRDACGADDTGCDILIVAAVVCASQDIVVSVDEQRGVIYATDVNEDEPILEYSIKTI